LAALLPLLFRVLRRRYRHPAIYPAIDMASLLDYPVSDCLPFVQDLLLLSGCKPYSTFVKVPDNLATFSVSRGRRLSQVVLSRS